MNRITVILAGFFLTACSSLKQDKKISSTETRAVKVDYGSPSVKQTLLDEQTFKISEKSTDPNYGYTPEKPIMVGSENGSGPLNERRFLNALAGPEGQRIKYYRIGSCCSFYTKNGLYGNGGLLDKYNVSYPGLKKDIVLYINMYDSDTLKVPVGFTLRK